MDDTIYFAVEFKSYDVTRTPGTAGDWYDWTERSRNFVTRTTFNAKALEWICQTLREASKTKGNTVRRWKKKDAFSEIYCARNYNKYGRYISLINIKGRRRAVIIIPEMTLNSGWSGIAEKIERFISSHKHVGNRGVHSKGEAPTLADIKRWTNDLWKQTYGLNIYEMGNDYFLFEFSSMITAEQVVEGNWSWRNSPVLFQWWNPTICTSLETERARTTWIKIVGMPLQFWSHGVFKAISDFCGGWVETEKETQLRNHLKWARIKVEGDSTKVPKEVTIDDGNLQFTMQIWTESPARVFAGEEQSQKIPSKVDIT
ncbi:hypothetical protein KY284_035792 [Solanum tuberosum]|nr:hypothetical protein KY284_035792 [Solanum tuberosum]